MTIILAFAALAALAWTRFIRFDALAHHKTGADQADCKWETDCEAECWQKRRLGVAVGAGLLPVTCKLA